jgi:2-oxo-4-hydroxy-4-carboxy--5-ureidoimidazoline (OHCU) decarboxylase
MSLKTFLMKKMMASQMKGVPQAEQDKLLTLIEKNPELFQKMGLEIQEEMKKGKDQMTAGMEVAKKYENELKKLI